MSLDRRRLAVELPVPPVVVATTGSTNADLRQLGRAGAPHGTVVIADHQTAGRGRLGRSWISAAGDNLLLSVLIRRPLPAAVAAPAAVPRGGGGHRRRLVAGAAYRIKWPNDVLAPDGRKVAGILAEADWAAGGLAHAVVGVGLNVRSAPDLPTATCLAAVDGPPRDRTTLAIALVAAILEEARGVEVDPAAVLQRWRRGSDTLGNRVRVGGYEGLAVDVDPDGALRLRTDDGVERRVVAGDLQG